ncbi:MAG: protein translocase subunit SecD [Thermoguttaceae bacterium]|jgi:SecD/SecF fusion protein
MTNEKLSLRPFCLGLVTLLAFAVGCASTATFAQDEAPGDQATAVATDNAAETPAVADQDPSVPEASTADSTESETAEPATDDASESVPEQFSETESEEAQVGPVASETTVVEQTNGKATSQRIFVFGSFILLCVLGYFFARLCVKKFQMKENMFGYFVIFFCFFGAVIATIRGLAESRVNLGVDLRGGSILVYSVEPNKESGSDTVSNEDMSGLKNAIMKRINPSGVREISIQELGANSEIKITIPEADDAEVARLERVINDTGQLKFRILASQTSTDAGERKVIEEALRPEFANEWDVTIDSSGLGDGIVVGASWLPVDPTQNSIIRQDCVVRESQYTPREDEIGTESVPQYDLLVLELLDSFDVNGSHIEFVQESVGQLGEPEVVFTMRPEGAKHMQRLTDRYKASSARDSGRQLGVVFNNRLFNAPNIQSTISDRGQITFGHDLSPESRQRIQNEVRDLIAVMHAGVLPATLSDKPITTMVTGPTLGADTIRKGKNAVVWGGIIVVIFMICYYGFGGFIASFAVLMNLFLIMTTMIAMRAAFTLPGLAGLVLTVGMAVDANILIFERIREELNGGAALRMAIRNGYQRAFTAIFDSNVTTMLTAWILYLVGSEQIKSFAVTLFLGVLFSLFTATYVCRIIFQSCEKAGWISKNCIFPLLPFMKPFGRPNFDFFKFAKRTYLISVAIIVIGLVAVVVRGKGIFDVDFVGGVEIQTVFTEPVDIGELRSTLKDQLPDLSVSELALAKDRDGNPVAPHTCYTISASCPTDKESDELQNDVEDILKESFAGKLRHYSMDYVVGDVEQVTPTGSTTARPRITVAVTTNPALSREVVTGYFEDSLPENSDLTFTVTNEAYQSGSNAPSSEWNVLFASGDKEAVEEISEAAQALVANQSAFEASNTVGSSVAGYARTQGILAILGSLVIIVAYLWFRFRHAVVGISAVVGLIHDVCFTLGLIGLSYWLAGPLGFLGITQFKIGLSTVAAFLSLIGYSLNDTIVLFDRLREVRGKAEALTVEIINDATNQVFSRTILTSLTTTLAVFVLYVFGGAGIHTFAFAMLVGVLVGTYSSVVICAPFLYWLLQRRRSKTPSRRVK